MDFTDRNLEAIQAIQLHDMTIEELVVADRQVESRFHFWKGMWWREVKPFFYQPAWFMMSAIPRLNVPKPWSALGGYYHVVVDGAFSNGSIVVNEISNLKTFQLESLPKNVRHDIRRGLSHLEIREVSNLEDLLRDGYRIYLAWEMRAGSVRATRSRFTVFRKWITRSYHHPHNLILGAYHDNRLIAYVMGHAVDGTAGLAKSFTDPDFYHRGASTTLIYAFAQVSKQTPSIRKLCNGLKSTKSSLERYKARLGFQQVSYPAFIHLRMGIRSLVRWWMPDQYRRLMGQYQMDLPSVPEGTQRPL
jgi:hypothetical protein